MMTAVMAVMRWAASTPVPTASSSAPTAAASQTTGPVMATTTAETSAMRTQPVEAPRPVRMHESSFQILNSEPEKQL